MSNRRPSAALVVSIVALVFAVAGTGVAGVTAITALSKKEKKQTRKIADREIEKLAPGLSVKSSETAATAASSHAATTAALGGTGRSAAASSCDPTGITFVNCAAVALSLPTPGRVLLTGTARFSEGSAGGSQIACSIGAADGSTSIARTTSILRGDNISLTGITAVLPAGTHSFGLNCAQFTIPDAVATQPSITAVALSAN